MLQNQIQNTLWCKWSRSRSSIDILQNQSDCGVCVVGLGVGMVGYNMNWCTQTIAEIVMPSAHQLAMRDAHGQSDPPLRRALAAPRKPNPIPTQHIQVTEVQQLQC